jgi:type I restriction enzyme S subunit
MKVNVGNDLYLKGRIGWKGLSKDEYLDKSDYRIINGYSLKDGYIDWDIAGYISEERYEESPEIKLEKNDILISKDGTIGKVGIVRNLVSPTTVASGIFVLRNIIADRLDTEYLFQYLKSSHFKAFINAVKASGSTIIHLYQRDLAKLEIDVPQLPIQKAISSILFSLDSKIELNNRINAELEAMAKTLYDYWFVQFDFPDENGNPYKTSGGKMVWNDDLKRVVPKGWEVKKLDDCIEKIVDYRGKTPKKLESDWSNNTDDIVALSAKHVKGGKLVNLSGANRVDKKLYNLWMKELLKNGDILMTSEAPCGEFFYLVGKVEYCLSQRLFAIRSNNKIVHHSYLYFELSSGNGYSQIQGKMSGSTVFGIRQDELRTVKVLIPEMKTQMTFSVQIEKMYLQIRNNEYQNDQLSELRDWLLPMLMNGQVKVGLN